MLKQTKAFDVAAFKVGGHITIDYLNHSDELLRALIVKVQKAKLTVYLYYDGKFQHFVIKASDTVDAEEIDHPWLTVNKLTPAFYADFLEAYQ